MLWIFIEPIKGTYSRIVLKTLAFYVLKLNIHDRTVLRCYQMKWKRRSKVILEWEEKDFSVPPTSRKVGKNNIHLTSVVEHGIKTTRTKTSKCMFRSYVIRSKECVWRVLWVKLYYQKIWEVYCFHFCLYEMFIR